MAQHNDHQRLAHATHNIEKFCAVMPVSSFCSQCPCFTHGRCYLFVVVRTFFFLLLWNCLWDIVFSSYFDNSSIFTQTRSLFSSHVNKQLKVIQNILSIFVSSRKKPGQQFESNVIEIGCLKLVLAFGKCKNHFCELFRKLCTLLCAIH